MQAEYLERVLDGFFKVGGLAAVAFGRRVGDRRTVRNLRRERGQRSFLRRNQGHRVRVLLLLLGGGACVGLMHLHRTALDTPPALYQEAWRMPLLLLRKKALCHLQTLSKRGLLMMLGGEIGFISILAAHPPRGGYQ